MSERILVNPPLRRPPSPGDEVYNHDYTFRRSKDGDELITGKVPEGLLADYVDFGLAPDGTLYSVTYGKDKSIPPRTVKCTFESN